MMTASRASLARYQEQQFRKLRIQRAGRLHAAKINGGAVCAEPRGSGRYTVRGRGDTRYTCVARSLDCIECDCKAGIYYGFNSCWHSAAVYLRMLADSAARGAGKAAA